jgi:hypothetical protein
MTRSILFDSIQQSPIDPLLDDLEGILTPGLGLLEEVPKAPPQEISMQADHQLRFRSLNPSEWVDQMPSKGLHGAGNIAIQKNCQGGITVSHNGGSDLSVSSNGLLVSFSGTTYPIDGGIPVEAVKLLHEAYLTIAAWRSRVVRLSMETDDYDCFLMDDLAPPRTFLVELKDMRSTVKSVKIQDGLSLWETGTGRSVTIPTALIEQEANSDVVVEQLLLEVRSGEFQQLWLDLIQLRGMCLDEDRRLIENAAHYASAAGG